MSIALHAVKGDMPKSFLPSEDFTMEELTYFRGYQWTMFDGEKFSDKIYYDSTRLYKEELSDVICHKEATLVWNDAQGVQYCKMKSFEINIAYMMNSILYFYKRRKLTPGKVCMLETVSYDPFHHYIYVEFAS